MDYEQKYEKALKVASQWHKDGIDDIKKVVECIFPELKESEDERIRKAAIEFVSQNNSFNYSLGISKEQVIAWLEKQGEQKASWSEEDEQMLERVIESMIDYQADAINNDHKEVEKLAGEEINWLESIKPNHWKPSEEEMEALLYALGKGGTYNHEALTKLYNNLKKL